MTEKEHAWDKLLHIKTSGRDDSNADLFCYPYEPTPYAVLERLAGTGLIGKKDVLVDYGCGKGRVGFFCSYQTKARTIGIEYDERIYLSASENEKTARSGNRTEFVLCRAENYVIPADANRFYFFNPFSVDILRQVMERIKESYRNVPRDMLLFFYYPSDEYLAYLMDVEYLDIYDEIACGDLFDGNDMREGIVIFSLAKETEE